MGWDSEKKRSKPVEIKQDFEIAACFVTQGRWGAVIKVQSEPAGTYRRIGPRTRKPRPGRGLL
jgi:hypothetical protein